MTPGHPCAQCGAGLDPDQRYCIECGARAGERSELPATTPAEAAGFSIGPLAIPVPVPLATTFAALALGFGVVSGTAISPNLSDTLAESANTIAQAPPPAPPPATGSAPAPAPTAGIAPPAGSFPAGGLFSGVPSGDAGGAIRTAKTKPERYTGTVVHTNPVAGSYVLASKRTLMAVHETKLPDVGDRLRVALRTLPNGTYEEDGKRKRKGTSSKAEFSGTVTFTEPLDTSAYDNPNYEDPTPSEDLYAVSARGVSLLVRAPDPGSDRDVDKAPPAGSSVNVKVEIADAPPAVAPSGFTPKPRQEFCSKPAPQPATAAVLPEKVLRQTSVEVAGQPVTTSELAAVIQGICPATGSDPARLLLSADDVRESELDLSVAVPARTEIDLGGFSVGDAVIVTGTIGKVSLPSPPANAPVVPAIETITGIRDDTRKAGARDTDGQGDLAGG